MKEIIVIGEISVAYDNKKDFEQRLKLEYKQHHEGKPYPTPNGRYGFAKEAAEHLERSYGKINVDAIDVDWCLQSNKVVFNNLYTFVLACGINVPYCDWIYEDWFEHGECIFRRKYNDEFRYEVAARPMTIKFDLDKINNKTYKF